MLNPYRSARPPLEARALSARGPGQYWNRFRGHPIAGPLLIDHITSQTSG